MDAVDAVDDLLQNTAICPPLPQWDPAQLHAFTSTDDVPDPTAPIFPTDAGSLPDPHELQLDIPTVPASLPASFPLSNALSFLPTSAPSATQTHPQLAQPHAANVNYSSNPQHAQQHLQSHPQQIPTSAPSLQHSAPAASSHSRGSLQQAPQIAVSQSQHDQLQHLRMQQHSAQSHPQNSVVLSRERAQDHQGSQDSQLSLLTPHAPQAPQRNPIENGRANGQPGIAIDSNQPQVGLKAAQARARSANRPSSSQLMRQNSAVASQKEVQQSPLRRRGSVAQQQQHSSVQTTGKQKKGAAAQRRQLPAQKPIGKQPRTPRGRSGNSRQQKQLQQQQSQLQQRQHMIHHQKSLQGESPRAVEQQATAKAQQPPQSQQQDFTLLPHQDESTGAPSSGNEQTLPHQQSRMQQQSQQNMFNGMGTASSIPMLSNIHIPTSTIATGTTLTGTPSTTNSTHRSPPNTPHSSNRGKPTVASGPREIQSDVHSSMDKSREEKQPTRKQQSVATTNAKSSQTSTKANNQAAPALGSATAQGVAPAAKVSKPRDKQAKLRKRLKCCTQEQLIEQMIKLVKSSQVPEKTVFDSLPTVDIGALVAKCKFSLDEIYALLPDDPSSATTPHDAEAYRRCKKALNSFKIVVITNGRSLVEAGLWTDVIRYCVAAVKVTEQMPKWVEASHNKARASIRSKLEQFANRSVMAFSKSKTDLMSAPDEHLQLAESCREDFPTIATQLEGLERPSSSDGPMESMDFDDPMISNKRLDLSL